ncbi:MAG: bifunctional oligoribonuclease/PAP phosphatase NrnA [Candidatus Hermodarchaeota archaeon]
MLKSKFDNFLAFIKNKTILITTHDFVDIDGLVSCFTLKYLLNQLNREFLNSKNPEISIYFSELSKSTKNFIKNFNKTFPKFDFSYESQFDLTNFDILVIVDTNNLNQIKITGNVDITNSKIPFIFIDHHYTGLNSEDHSENSLDLISKNYSSTSEIIMELFEFSKKNLTLPLKNLIISAILTDSGFFRHGNNKSIQNVSKLLSEEVDIQDIYQFLQGETDISEKIANIKGIQRVELIREGEFLIGLTNVSSFGASVATMLIKLGFDIGIVVSKEANQYTINTRAKKAVCLKTGLNLGKILEEISVFHNASGGGHDGAASITIDKKLDIILQEIIERLKHYL